jgi:hypothetical protein
MSHLESGLGPGLEIETNSSSDILRDYIEANWPTTVGSNPNLPLKSSIDFGGSPDRTTKIITLKTYTIFSNIVNADIGGSFFSFDVPVAIDIFVRDTKASAERREPQSLVAIETYLRDFISTNRLGLRSKGINNMMVSTTDYIEEKPDNEQDVVWYHLVVTVRIYYHMRRVD